MTQPLAIAALAATVWLSLPAQGAQEAAVPDVVTADTLRAGLLRLAGERLHASGLSIDAADAQVGTSRPLAPGAGFELVALWPSGRHAPPLPLQFELRPVAVGAEAPVRAWLSAPLLREVLVPRHKAARGAALSCDELAVERKPLRLVPAQALMPPCALAGAMVLKRALLPGEPLRAGDLGPVQAVTAHQAVSVRVVVGQVALEKSGVALGDGDVGDSVRVRLSGTAQPVDAKVVAEKLVLLEERK